jgi:hypothetical protein
MKVKSITIKNIGLIENETIEINKPLLLFYGDIRQGKTTILNAIRWAFGGSFLADIIRHGQTEAVIDIVFDNGSINRSFYVNKEGETTARPQNIVINGRVAKVSDLKQFLNPFLLNQNYLVDMNKKDERSNFIIDLFGVNTVDIDTSITNNLKEASELRATIKGYGEIILTEVVKPELEKLEIELAECKQSIQKQQESASAKNTELKTDWYNKKQILLDDVLKFNSDQDLKRSAIETNKSMLNEVFLKVKGTIFEKCFDVDGAKKILETLPIALEKKSTIIDLPEPIYQVINVNELIRIEGEINNAKLQQVKYDQYLKDKSRFDAKESDQVKLKELEQLGRVFQKQRIGKLSEINGKITGLKATENGLFFENTSFDMLSTSQIMNLSSQLSGLYPEGFGLELIDRGESLGKSIFEFVIRATKEQKTILAAIVGERPASVPENIGVFVVDNGKIS